MFIQKIYFDKGNKFYIFDLMKFFLVLFSIAIFFTSCSAVNHAHGHKTITTAGSLKSKNKDKKESLLTTNILSNAENYLGVPYKLGGMTSSGMDCSGLIVRVFGDNHIKMPRRSIDQAKEGMHIHIKDVRRGDLLFFATINGSSDVSHIGIVHTIEQSGEIKFIHASTKRGVIISSLDESYWNKAFLFAKRVIS